MMDVEHLQLARKFLLLAITEPAHTPTEDALIDCINEILNGLHNDKQEQPLCRICKRAALKLLENDGHDG